MQLRSTGGMAGGLAAMALSAVAGAQESRWAGAGDATAQSIIAMERQWAEEVCTHKVVVDSLLADDFEGVSPDGKRYTKAQAVHESQSSKEVARACQLDDAEVHFFGDTMAVAYGHERFVSRNTESGAEETRCLVWTDTWLKRNGRWQIVAAQDMWGDCK